MRNGSGLPTSQASHRPVKTTGIPEASMARRAARMRSAARFFSVKRFCVVSRVVLNRQAGDALRDTELCISGHRFGLIGESVQEIGVDWQRCGSSDFTDVPEHFVEGNAAIGFATGKGETGRGGSERFEAELSQVNRRADIPWVGQDKTA